MLIGLVGKKGVGKDAVGDYLASKRGYQKYAFALPIKQVCAMVFQVNPEEFEGDRKERVDSRHNMTPRQMLQTVGTDMFRNLIHHDFWIKHFLTFYEQTGKNINLVVCDARFQNEINVIKQLGGTVVRITREKKGTGRHTLCDSHISEQGIDNLVGIDVEVENSGTLEDLWNQIEAMLI